MIFKKNTEELTGQNTTTTNLWNQYKEQNMYLKIPVLSKYPVNKQKKILQYIRIGFAGLAFISGVFAFNNFNHSKNALKIENAATNVNLMFDSYEKQNIDDIYNRFDKIDEYTGSLSFNMFVISTLSNINNDYIDIKSNLDVMKSEKNTTILNSHKNNLINLNNLMIKNLKELSQKIGEDDPVYSNILEMTNSVHAINERLNNKIEKDSLTNIDMAYQDLRFSATTYLSSVSTFNTDENFDKTTYIKYEQKMSSILDSVKKELNNVGDVNSKLNNDYKKIEVIKVKLNKMIEEASSLSNMLTVHNAIYLFILISSISLFAIATLLMLKLDSIAISITGKLAEKENIENNDAIRNLLSEISVVSNGDFTAKATVSETITASIADAFNDIVSNLRNLMLKVNNSSSLVKDASNQVNSIADNLLEISDKQTERLGNAANNFDLLNNNFHKIKESSELAENLISESIKAGEKGMNSIHAVLHGNENIRTSIQETSKKIKDVGQNITQLREVQDNIHVMNNKLNQIRIKLGVLASECTDNTMYVEIKKLYEGVQDIYKDNQEDLVKIKSELANIQEIAGDAIFSMENTTTRVISGDTLAKNSEEAFKEVAKIMSKQSLFLGNLVKEIELQSNIVENLLSEVNSIKMLSEQNTDSVADLKDIIQADVNVTLENLEDSVSLFKLG